MSASNIVGFDFWLLLQLLAGLSLVIASACVVNNYIDRDIDQYMSRTKRRALVLKTIKPSHAIIYAAVLGTVGFSILSIYTNWSTVILGWIGYIDYIIFYGWGKRRSRHGTLIGSVAGATPIAAGYTAVSGHFDIVALLLFITMVCWQMPHFYAIAMRRIKEYKAAKIPVLPIKKGMPATKIQILIYIVAFFISASLLFLLGYTGLLYLLIIAVISLYWLQAGIRGFFTDDDTVWAKRMFLISLMVMVVFSLALIIDSLLGGKIV